jgi:SOS-response transcriptional repressor LexA
VDTLAERLSSVLKEKQITQKKLADKLGINAQQIQAVCSGKILRPSNIVEISEVLNISPFWLQAGKGPKNLHKQNNLLSTMEKIPVIEWSDILSPEAGKGLEWIAPPYKTSPKAYALKVQGRSMVGGDAPFLPGSYIIIEPDTSYIDGSFVIVSIKNKPSLRQVSIESDQVFLHLLNQQYPDAIIPLSNEDRILGKVVYLINSLG